MKSVIFVLSFLVVLQFIPADSIKCYVCNNFEHKSGCGHSKDVDENFLVDCNDQPVESGGVQGAKYEFCRKIVTLIEFDVNNNTETQRITRKCGYLSSKYDEECYYRGGFGGRQTVCTCKGDACNSGFMFGVNPLLMGVAAVVATFYTMRS